MRTASALLLTSPAKILLFYNSVTLVVSFDSKSGHDLDKLESYKSSSRIRIGSFSPSIDGIEFRIT
jgi:hypothetical protein